MEPFYYWPLRLKVASAIIAVLLVVACIGVIVFESTHTCTQWGPYYTIWIPITSGHSTIFIPEQTRDCIGQWVPNK